MNGLPVCFRRFAKVWPDGTVAVDHVDLDVPIGQFCVVLGASGAGKSTLLRGVNGLVEPTDGQVAVGGEVVERRNLRRIRRRVGMIHQSFNLTPRLSVLANVCCGALAELPAWRTLLKWFPRDLQRRACHLLHDVGLDERHLYRRASELSGGQQQRVGIARALALGPGIILADEPVASLDPSTSREILALLKRSSRERGCTVLCSLHQVDLTRAFADRVVGMSHGRVIFDGPPDELDEDTLRLIYDGRTRPSAGSAEPVAREPMLAGA